MRKRFIADIENLPQVTAFVNEAIQDGNKHLQLVIEELFVNICLYSYPQNGGEIEVSVESQPIKITFRDWGQPFDPTAQNPPPKPKTLEEAHIGGLGIHFVRTIAKSIVYERDNATNITTIQM